MSYTVRNLVIALGLALVGIVLATSYIRGQKASITRGSQHVVVLQAKKDIPAGTKASGLESGGYVERKEVLRSDATPTALGPDDLKKMEQLSTSQTVYSGEQLSQHKFETVSGLTPTAQIKGTERLISIPITSNGSVAGLVHPNDHVDLVASGSVKDVTSPNATSVNCTWIAARDVIVRQTPTSLAGGTAGAAPVVSPKASDGPQLYVLQVSDKVAQALIYSNSFSDNSHLVMMLRPSDGDQETSLPKPVCAIPPTT